jgi:short-subunit dehydrogenase
MAIPSPERGCAALVTGASSGIGAELARQLGARGHDVILVARRRERLEELALALRGLGRRAEVVCADVSDGVGRAGLVAEVAELGLQLDVLVLCAGFGLGGAFLEEDPDRVVRMVRTNVESTMALCGAFLPAMAARRRGAVLIVSSMAGGQPMPGFAAYAATKAAVTSFAEALSYELRPSGVTVTALAPGGVRTEFSAVAGMSHTEKQTPGALMIDVEECARAGLDGLEQGARIVMPRRAVRVLAWMGSHLPRAVWMPLCRRLMA